MKSKTHPNFSQGKGNDQHINMRPHYEPLWKLLNYEDCLLPVYTKKTYSIPLVQYPRGKETNLQSRVMLKISFLELVS